MKTNRWKVYVIKRGEMGDGIELEDVADIRFIYDDNRNTVIDVNPSEESGCLEIFGQQSLQILPGASNHIHIKSIY